VTLSDVVVSTAAKDASPDAASARALSIALEADLVERARQLQADILATLGIVP